jgi:ABC-type transporter Mla MlaB component
MMLKITKIHESRSDVFLKLEGKITAEWATLLDGECWLLLRQEKTVHLDCAHVDFIDARGVEVLNNLPRTHVTLMSAPGFMTKLLEIGAQS